MDPKETQTTNPATEGSLQTPPELRAPLVKANLEGGSAERGLKEAIVLPAPSEGHAKFADAVHQYVREYIRNADQKAAFFFAATTALLAFLHSRNAASRWLRAPGTWNLTDLIAFLAMVGLAGAAGVLLSVVFPRLKGSRRGILFFNAIAEYDSASEYAEDVLRQPAADFARIQLQHAFELSRICRRKYRALTLGLYIGCAGAGATLVYLLLG